MYGQISPRDAARLRAYSNVTQIAAAASVVMVILFVAACFWSYAITRSNVRADEARMVSAGIGAGILAVVGMVGATVSVLVAGIGFLLWFHKAIANLHEAQLPGLRAKPLWSAISLFVPVAQLFVPFFAMRELWNRSHGEDEYQSRASVTTVTIWWLCLLTGSFITTFVLLVVALFIFSSIKLIAPGLLNFMLLIVGLCFLCTAAACLVVILRRITAAQASLLDGNAIFA
jgi:hypothetical protein